MLMTKQHVPGKLLIVFFSLLSICGCATSPGNASLALVVGDRYEPKGEEETVRGVVNGLYKLDSDQTLADLQEYDEHLSAEVMTEYANRYAVRVGVNWAPALSVISPIVIGARWLDYVLLPADWKHSPTEFSNEPQVINVGDIVDVKVRRGRRYDFFVALVRKCDEDPAEDENPDWDIGCKTYEGFNDKGYAGEYYNFRMF